MEDRKRGLERKLNKELHNLVKENEVILNNLEKT